MPGTSSPEAPPGRVNAGRLWEKLCNAGSLFGRFAGAAPWVCLYLVLGLAVMELGGTPASPTRGTLLTGGVAWPTAFWLTASALIAFAILLFSGFRREGWTLLVAHVLLSALPFLPSRLPSLDRLLLWFSIGAFLFLTFVALETSLRCRRFIAELGAFPTEYPVATRRHFARRHGGLDDRFLDEWIDVQLIADLTERIGGLLWFPSIVLLLMLAARSEWWDQWEWTPGLRIVMSLNFLCVLLCVFVVQRAARTAKRAAREQLAEKIRTADAGLAPTPAANDANQAKRLLDEIDDLERGAFVGFWKNPVIGALLVPSGGTVIIELMMWALGR